MDFFAEIISTDETLKAVEAAVKELKQHDVLVGIPQEKSNRQGSKGKATNAELLFKDDKERIGEMLGKAIDAATSGKKEEIVPALERAGMYASGKCKAWFTNASNGWKPNSKETIARKKSSRPLIDTAEMRKSITYVVK